MLEARTGSAYEDEREKRPAKPPLYGSTSDPCVPSTATRIISAARPALSMETLPARRRDQPPRPRLPLPRHRVRDRVLQGELGRDARYGIVAVEAGPAQPAPVLFGGPRHALYGEVGQARGPDLLTDLLNRKVRADKVVGAVHVYAVVAGARDRR